MNTQNILDEILGLPAKTRIHIAEQIWKSLTPTDPEIEQAWVKEAARRDKAPLSEDIPGEQVLEELKKITLP